jgi:uncharacterized membrane protein
VTRRLGDRNSLALLVVLVGLISITASIAFVSVVAAGIFAGVVLVLVGLLFDIGERVR